MIAERNYGCRLSEFSIYGHRALAIENECLRVGILVGRGMTVYELLDKRTDTDFMFRERRGLSRLNGYEPSREGPQGAFWDYMIGGWFEMFPNVGRTCELNGQVYGQHGEVMNMPWTMEILSDTPACVCVRCTVRTMRADFELERVMELRGSESCLRVRERLTNLSPCPQPYVWGHHITLGEAFLNEHCRIDAPTCVVQSGAGTRLLPNATGTLCHMPDKQGGTLDESIILSRDSHVSEMLYLRDMASPWCCVTDRQKGVGIGVSWDGTLFRAMWLWKEFCASEGFPLFGDTYAMSLEPCVSATPMIRNAYEAGEAQVLEGRAARDTWLTITVHHDTRPVRAINQDGRIDYEEGE